MATLAVSVALLGGTALVASGQTGAYFSSSAGGGITGTIGTINVTNQSSSYISFSDLLPGSPQTLQMNYQNSGNSPADVWINFDQATALSALNNLGRYGSFTVASSALGTVFTSSNLDDNNASDACGSFSNTPASGPTSGCWPVPQLIKIASNVPSGGTGTVYFTFEYASKLGNTPATSWNSWPLPGDNGMSQTYAQCETYYGSNPLPAGDSSAHAACSDNQVTINAGDGNGSGLPFQLDGTQVGITPGQVGTKF
ncbi:MAG: hypothetical protein ACYDB2_09210 [Acidimicrobiales bacterium]